MGGKARKKKAPPAAATPDASVGPTIYRARLGPRGTGRVFRLQPPITLEEAIDLRTRDIDVVVCGPNKNANRALARQIEAGATGPDGCEAAFPHVNSAGPHALPHWQPVNRPPQGHTFYETEHRHAADEP
jgi:hypothetical protein